jgi:AcrR family transcriptional regulator
MTQPGDTIRKGYGRDPNTRRRNKLAPDPGVRRAIMAAAAKSVREQGVRGLSIAAVLDYAQLSTRAFYRHFESKDQLVAAVFLDMARTEMSRVQTRMDAAANPIEAVAEWIDGRLDLAFDEDIAAELRCWSLEAQSQMVSSPELVEPAYNATLEPLMEQLERGVELGFFRDIVPTIAARSIQGVVWASTQRQWANGDCKREDVRDRAIRFCLQGLGVTPDAIAKIITRQAPVS